MSEHPVEETVEEELKRDWETGFCDCCYIGTCCCILSFVPCVGDSLVNAYALSNMEANNSIWFHFICSPAPMARNYMAISYGLDTRFGYNCCLAACCRGCSAAQLYGHTLIAGPIKKTPVNLDFPAHFVGMPRECNDATCMDPMHCIHNCICVHCVSSSHMTSITGLPAWLCCYTSYCLNHHILRLNFGVPGLTHWNDCLEPLFFLSCIFTPGLNIFCGWCCANYFSQQLENERSIMRHAATTNASRFFLAFRSEKTHNQDITLQEPRAQHDQIHSIASNTRRRKISSTPSDEKDDDQVPVSSQPLPDQSDNPHFETTSPTREKELPLPLLVEEQKYEQLREKRRQIYNNNLDENSWVIGLATRIVPDFDLTAPARALPRTASIKKYDDIEEA